jgi:hypothetical protein
VILKTRLIEVATGKVKASLIAGPRAILSWSPARLFKLESAPGHLLVLLLPDFTQIQQPDVAFG